MSPQSAKDRESGGAFSRVTKLQLPFSHASASLARAWTIRLPSAVQSFGVNGSLKECLVCQGLGDTIGGETPASAVEVGQHRLSNRLNWECRKQYELRA